MRYASATLGLLALAAACTAPPAPPAPTPPAPRALLYGCDGWTVRDVCTASADLTLWVEGDQAPRIHLPGWTAGPAEHRLGGYTTVLTPGHPEPPPAVLRFEAFERSGEQHRIAQIVRARPATDLEGMTTETLLELVPTLSPDARAEVLEATRRRLWRRPGEALRPTLALAELSRAREDPSARARYLALGSLLLRKTARIAEARDLLGQVPPTHPADARATIVKTYYGANLAGALGQPGETVRQLLEVRTLAARLRLTTLERDVSQVMLPLLDDGGHGDMIPAIETALLDSLPGLECRQARTVLTNLTWARLRRADAALATRPSLTATLPPDLAALDLARRAHRHTEKCGGAVHNSLSNLALAALQSGDPSSALAYLAKIPAHRRQANLRIFEAMTRGRIALAMDRPRIAAEAFASTLALPYATTLERWQATTGLGQAQLAFDDDQGVRTLRRAEALADDLADEGRLLAKRRSLVSRSLHSARLLVDALAAAGRNADAAQVAEHAWLRTAITGRPGEARASDIANEEPLTAYASTRARLERLRMDLWSAPTSQTPALEAELEHVELVAAQQLADALAERGSARAQHLVDPPDAISVLAFPGVQRWWLFSTAAGTSSVAFVPSPARTTDLERAIATLAQSWPPLTRDRRIRVRATPGFPDLREARLDGQPLGLRAAVERVVASARTAASSPRTAHALLAGSTGPHLRTAEETTEAKRTLEARQVQVEVLPAGASAVETAARLDVDLFHFAGHARRSAKTLRSGLELDTDQWLTAADVLTLRHVPRQVVLSACDTGDSDAPGWSIAEAFLSAGAQEVLATKREVHADDAARLGARIHETDGPLAVRLTRATQQILVDKPTFDWSAFQVLAR